MSTLIICPKCKTEFEPEDAIKQTVEENVRKEFNQKWAEFAKQKDQQLQDEKKTLEATLRKELEQKVGTEYENQLRLLEDANKTNQAKLKEARDRELDFLKKMQELQTREQELELQMQRRMVEERSKLTETIMKEEEERNKQRDTEFQMKLKEKELQLEAQRKHIEEMKRKMEQGSMQLQGEVQELALEELLRDAFIFDMVSEIGKGKKGADCILTVRNNFGQECGTIYFESKRTKDFGKDWIEKLKADMRVLNAEVGIIVTQKMPDDMKSFGQKDGVWICQFSEVKAVVEVIREMVIRVYNASKSQENVGDKKTLLYNYLNSPEFHLQWHAILEGYVAMKGSIDRERIQMDKLWKARETQLGIVLKGLTNIKGSVEGIAGSDIPMNLLTNDSTYLLE